KSGLRVCVSRIRPARRDPHGQRPALLVAGTRWSVESGGLVDPPRHPPRTDRARPTRPEWPARAHAPDAEGRDSDAAESDAARAAAHLRHLSQGVQPGPAARGAWTTNAGEPLRA